MPIISPQEALSALLANAGYGFLDVRSEAEWEEGAIPGFVNGPILSNAERHQVGTCYKQHGQEAAIALGKALTAAHQAQRIEQWSRLNNARGLIVCCWRGGLRSRMACEWLESCGVTTHRVRGGYKAMRALLRGAIENPPPLLVLSGVTGSGKTRLLRELAVPKVDLEAAANHRGSAFGELGAQPAQQWFENRFALDLWQGAQERLVEDESKLIGRLEVPPPFKQLMKRSPVVVLEVGTERRLWLTHDEYVLAPMRQGLSAQQIEAQLLMNLQRIRNKLGGLRCSQLQAALQQAFEFPSSVLDASAHAEWILPLLQEYYDPRYRYGFEQQGREVLFRGDADAVSEYLLKRQRQSAH